MGDVHVTGWSWLRQPCNDESFAHTCLCDKGASPPDAEDWVRLCGSRVGVAHKRARGTARREGLVRTCRGEREDARHECVVVVRFERALAPSGESLPGKSRPRERRENGPRGSVAGRRERATRATTRGGAESSLAHLDIPPKTNRRTVAMGPPAAEFQVPDAVARRRADATSPTSVQERFRADHMAAALRERAAFGAAETETARDILLEAAPLLVAKKLVVPDDTMVRAPPRPPTPRPRRGGSRPLVVPFPPADPLARREASIARKYPGVFMRGRFRFRIRLGLPARARPSTATPPPRSPKPGGSRSSSPSTPSPPSLSDRHPAIAVPDGSLPVVRWTRIRPNRIPRCGTRAPLSSPRGALATRPRLVRTRRRTTRLER